MEKMLLSRDWSSLPTDAAREIADRLWNDADYTCFRSVCTNWRSAAPKRLELPWLLVRKSPASLRLCKFSNTSELFTPQQLPNEDVMTYGSSLGWIFLLEDSLALSIHNPFTGRRISLPRLPEMPYRVIRSSRCVAIINTGWPAPPPSVNKHFHRFRFAYGYLWYGRYAAMSSDPATAPDDCIVVTQSNNTRTLMYCRPGDASWTPFPFQVPSLVHFSFYKGRLYALSMEDFRLFVYDTGPGARATEISPANPLFTNGQPRKEECFKYLAVSSGDLFLVAFPGPWQQDEESCEVFQVDLDGGELRFVKLENLGGRALFVGCEGSMPIFVGNSSWCKGNCVYYLRCTGSHDTIVVYDLVDESISYIDSPSDEGWGTHFLTPS